MKRRQFLKTIGAGLAGGVASLFPTQGAEPVILGVDVAAPGPNETIVEVSDDLGGYLVPPEFQERLVQAGQTNEQKAACGAFAEYLKGQTNPPGKGMYYELQSARTIAERRSEWPGFTAPWRKT